MVKESNIFYKKPWFKTIISVKRLSEFRNNQIIRQSTNNLHISKTRSPNARNNRNYGLEVLANLSNSDFKIIFRITGV